MLLIVPNQEPKKNRWNHEIYASHHHEYRTDEEYQAFYAQQYYERYGDWPPQHHSSANGGGYVHHTSSSCSRAYPTMPGGQQGPEKRPSTIVSDVEYPEYIGIASSSSDGTPAWNAWSSLMNSGDDYFFCDALSLHHNSPVKVDSRGI